MTSKVGLVDCEIRFIWQSTWRDYNTHLITYLINRSSVFSDNHRERDKLLERHKVAGTPTQPCMKIKKTKIFKYMSRVVCQKQT